MKNNTVEVSYLDAVNGGSGLTRMDLTEVPTWLARRPGLVIRELIPVGTLEDSAVYARNASAGRQMLADQLVRQGR